MLYGIIYSPQWRIQAKARISAEQLFHIRRSRGCKWILTNTKFSPAKMELLMIRLLAGGRRQVQAARQEHLESTRSARPSTALLGLGRPSII